MTTPTTDAAAPAAAAAAPAPQVDMAKLAEHAAKAATEAAVKTIDEQVNKKVGEKMQAAAAVLTGAEKPDPQKRALEMFVNDPLGTMNNIISIAKNEVKKEFGASKNIEDTQARVFGAAIQEYPQLKEQNKVALAEKLAENYVAEGQPYEKALELALKDTAKEFGLKSVSELQKEGNYSGGLPGGGGYSPRGGSGFDDKKSSSDFLSGMRTRLQSVRSKAPPKKD